MILELHPYETFIPKKPKMMMIGSFPIGKFSNPKKRHEIKSNEFDFFFGGEKNLLWKLIGECYGIKIDSTSKLMRLLERKGIAIGDVIKACKRKEGRASDSDLYDIVWNEELLEKIRENKITTILFTSKQVEKWFNRLYPQTPEIEKILLISPSAQSARSVVRNPAYKSWKLKHPQDKIYNFILQSYRRYFR